MMTNRYCVFAHQTAAGAELDLLDQRRGLGQIRGKCWL